MGTCPRSSVIDDVVRLPRDLRAATSTRSRTSVIIEAPAVAFPHASQSSHERPEVRLRTVHGSPA